MRFKINRDHFTKGLAQVLNVVSTKTTTPILGNVLIEASGEQVALTTTNLDLSIRCQIKAEVLEAGDITLPVKRLNAIIKELPALEVEVTTTSKQQAKIVSGGSVFKISGMGRDEFPAITSAATDEDVVFALKQAELHYLLKSVAYAQSTDETRYVLNGVFFNFNDGKLSVVATDGRRLSIATQDMETPKTGSMILPASGIAELQRLLDRGTDVQLRFNGRRAAFYFQTDKAPDSGLVGDIYLQSKVVEGNYPNYKQVIPKELPQRIKLERELFQACVHRVALVCSEKANNIKLRFSPNQLELIAMSPDFGEAHERMAINYDGPDIQVAFNPIFLQDPLKSLTADEVFFEVKDEMSPGVIRTAAAFTSVIMPVRTS